MGIDALLGMTGRTKPVNVMMSVTDRCTSRCAYCRIPDDPRPDIPTKGWLDLIDQMASAGTRRIGVWGGEPLIRDDIVELCRHARTRGIYVSLDTNGWLLPSRPEVLEVINHLVVAYDGPREAHDANRQSGAHEKAVRALETASGRVRTWTITVLTRNNLRSVDHILDQARRYGFMATFQTLHHNDVLGCTPEGMMPSREEYAEVFRLLLDRKRRGAPIANSSLYLESIAGWPDFSSTTLPGRFHGVRCSAGRMYCNIDADGRVYPCSLLIGMVPAVNALEAGFLSAFRAIGRLPCQACTAGCFTEYNQLYALRAPVILDWMRSVAMTDRLRKAAAAGSTSPIR
jgi:MoaA/NifB/PqqE/SkfB family radical SAM enzyme